MEEEISDRISQLVATFGRGRNTVFAELIGDSEANIRNYRTGRSTPKYAVLLNIINKLGVSPEWLMSGTGSMTSGKADILAQALPDEATPIKPKSPKASNSNYAKSYGSPRIMGESLPCDDELIDMAMELPLSIFPEESEHCSRTPSEKSTSKRESRSKPNSRQESPAGDDVEESIAQLHDQVKTCLEIISEMLQMYEDLSKDVSSLKSKMKLFKAADEYNTLYKQLRYKSGKPEDEA